MADKYFAGQRVRMIGLVKSSHLNNIETNVVRKMGIGETEDDSVNSYAIDRLNLSNPCGYVVIREKNLEPISDSGEKFTWSECAWKPNWIKSHG